MRPIALAAALLALPSAAAAFSYSEAVDGDLSGNRRSPTSLTAAPGSNLLTVQAIQNDLDYVRVAVPAGSVLGSILLVSFTSTDDLAFIAVQAAILFTEPPIGTDVSRLLGWTHFGVGPAAGGATPGTDILDDLGRGAGAIGFMPPLASGTYTFWMQQTQLAPSSWTLDFQVVPEPATALLLGLGLAAMPRIRRS
jgi:hypothetical protein